jgi:uncharacterized membrane protein (UPF0127 family)
MLRNNTRKAILARDVELCGDILEKATGLMFRRKLDDKAMVFVFDKERTIGLHMLFVFQSIDVLWLDKDKRIVELKEDFKPFTAYTPSNKAFYVVELPSGAIKRSRTKIKDVISWIL